VGREYTVLVVEDDVGFWFRGDDTPRRDGSRLTLFDLCETEQQLHDELDQIAKGGDVLPDLVLLDDRLHDGASGLTRRKAIDMVMWITTRFEDPPKCVLTTASPDPTFCQAFCELGGDNIIDKHRPHERLDIIWRTLYGERWTHERSDVASLSVLDVNGRLLPYMEHARWRQSAERDLDITPQNLSQRKSRLAKALGVPADADRQDFVDTALAQGVIWVPLVYRHLLPPEHPEHRPQRFAPAPR
jgi:hypothetical protein